jgi:very-short-patch-repair endonuclease
MNETFDLDEIFESQKHEVTLNNRIDKSNTYFDKLKALREYYKNVEPEIIKLFKEGAMCFYSSYPMDWWNIFTPIESMAWNSIRTKGHVPLYPQYPVLNYFVDFGNPSLKIGLELDGKGFHDVEKDKIRDRTLLKEGWTIYRIPGSQMVDLNYKEYYDCDYDQLSDEEREVALRHWILNTGDGVIEAIKVIHFKGHTYNDYIVGFCMESLDKHKLT